MKTLLAIGALGLLGCNDGHEEPATHRSARLRLAVHVAGSDQPHGESCAIVVPVGESFIGDAWYANSSRGTIGEYLRGFADGTFEVFVAAPGAYRVRVDHFNFDAPSWYGSFTASAPGEIIEMRADLDVPTGPSPTLGPGGPSLIGEFAPDASDGASLLIGLSLTDDSVALSSKDDLWRIGIERLAWPAEMPEGINKNEIHQRLLDVQLRNVGDFENDGDPLDDIGYGDDEPR